MPPPGGCIRTGANHGPRRNNPNLWYIYDSFGAIYSVRVRPYVGTGADEEKLSMLRRAATVDWLIAHPFPIPERFHTTIVEGGVQKKVAVAFCDLQQSGAYGTELALFEDAIRAIESQLPAQTGLNIPDAPLVCITPLLADDDNRLHPQTHKTMRRSAGRP